MTAAADAAQEYQPRSMSMQPEARRLSKAVGDNGL